MTSEINEIARLYNAVETITFNTIQQSFDYLLVLDFEATCWEKGDLNKAPSEIIEFPCVLYNVRRREIVEEFQQYVMPLEHPKLSPFCIQLTGIKQEQVDKGVPLNTCLMLFNTWINYIMDKHKIAFTNELSGQNTCTFATWSDWDLGTCLKKECNRKNIFRSAYFLKWMDVRAIYKEHYLQRPINGLSGALSNCGMTFEGIEHCGLHDARNTARLIGKMVDDGV